MIQPEGFIDLRASTGDRTAEDSVWPSFTDIMTVVVMIFLMALVVILIRNVELVRQLRQTIMLEQESAAQSDTLELRIATLADEIATLQLRLGEADALRIQAESTTISRQQEIRKLLGDVAALERVRDQVMLENRTLSASQKSLKAELGSMEQKQQILVRLEQELRTELAVLALQRDTLAADKAILSERNASVSQKLISVEQTLVIEQEQFEVERELSRETTLSLEQKLAELVDLKAIMEEQIQLLILEKGLIADELSKFAEENAGLTRKLSALTQFKIQLESEVIDLASQRQKLEDDKRRLVEENRDTTTWLANLLALKRDLENKQAVLQKENVALTDRTTLLETNLIEQERALTSLAETQNRYELTKVEMDYLVAKHENEIAEFQAEKELLVNSLKPFELLQEKYGGDLEEAYNRLVKPARTMVGRHVVRVRYWKDGGRYYHSLQEPGQVNAVAMSELQLHERLQELKDDHPGKLYTHVLFPNGASLTHEEAYLFERSIVSRYDYTESDDR